MTPSPPSDVLLRSHFPRLQILLHHSLSPTPPSSLGSWFPLSLEFLSQREDVLDPIPALKAAFLALWFFLRVLPTLSRVIEHLCRPPMIRYRCLWRLIPVPHFLSKHPKVQALPIVRLSASQRSFYTPLTASGRSAPDPDHPPWKGGTFP